jgi:hypothetical protein
MVIPLVSNLNTYVLATSKVLSSIFLPYILRRINTNKANKLYIRLIIVQNEQIYPSITQLANIHVEPGNADSFINAAAVTARKAIG